MDPNNTRAPIFQSDCTCSRYGNGGQHWERFAWKSAPRTSKRYGSSDLYVKLKEGILSKKRSSTVCSKLNCWKAYTIQRNRKEMAHMVGTHIDISCQSTAFSMTMFKPSYRILSQAEWHTIIARVIKWIDPVTC